MYRKDDFAIPGAQVEEIDECARRRVQLIETLRDRTKWPEGFEFDFGHHCTCAIGLMHRVMRHDLTGSREGSIANVERMAGWLGVPVETAWDLFGPFREYAGHPSYDRLKYNTAYPGPEMVADRLEQTHREILRSAARAKP